MSFGGLCDFYRWATESPSIPTAGAPFGLIQTPAMVQYHGISKEHERDLLERPWVHIRQSGGAAAHLLVSDEHAFAEWLVRRHYFTRAEMEKLQLQQTASLLNDTEE